MFASQSLTETSIYLEGFHERARPSLVRIYVTGERGAVETIAAEFPKSANLRVCPVSAYDEATGGYVREAYWMAKGTAKLASDDVNGGVNESGIRRYRGWARVLDASGLVVEWGNPAVHYGNLYASREQFEAAL